jgi:hypothetical protein
MRVRFIWLSAVEYYVYTILTIHLYPSFSESLPFDAISEFKIYLFREFIPLSLFEIT